MQFSHAVVHDVRVRLDWTFMGATFHQSDGASGPTDNPVSPMAHGPWRPNARRTRVKTYDIEVQRLKSVRHDKGLIELGVDVLVQPRPAREDQSAASSLSLSVEHARTLLILLKQQFAELDKLQPRSRRSGRA